MEFGEHNIVEVSFVFLNYGLAKRKKKKMENPT